jgi:hypothetical protein
MSGPKKTDAILGTRETGLGRGGQVEAIPCEGPPVTPEATRAA